ncbi:MAG: iron-containing alcohol dehydrogenase [Candidatus Cloacimonas sp.]
MDAFSFYNPTRIEFGVGKIKRIGSELQNANIKSCLMVAGSGSIKANGVYDQVLESLTKANIRLIEGWGVQSNPTLEKVKELCQIAKQDKVEAILAVGGGSVIDTAKTVAAGVYLDNIWDVFEEKESIRNALPIYTVLTISATGSEMNGTAVITNSQTLQKWGVYSPLLYPRVSIIDPSVQNSLPFKQTANGAMDAIAHILEFYFADEKAIATLAIDDALQKTIIEMTNRLQVNGNDLLARSNLAWCATMALNGISGIGLRGGDWACHNIEHSFSALHPDIAHGEGLGVIFPAWIEYMSEKDPARFLRWAKNVWDEENVSRALHRFRDKLEGWGMAKSLRDLGIKENELPQIVKLIMISPKIGMVSQFTAAEVESLLMLAF